jgi:putative flavoprotein involved in K+ transport
MSVRGDVRGRSEHFAAGVERFETVIIGGGQAGLSVGYQLAKRGRQFVILEANGRIGDSWRKRWDSLRLFTPARYNGLERFPFPADGWSFPTKDEMADYLEAYAARFELPVRTGVRVEKLYRDDDRFVVETQADIFQAENVVVAMADFQRPRVPEFAKELNPDIVQLHSYEYRNPSQLHDGGVLIVGTGNSGPRSRSSSPAPIAPGCRAGTPATCRSASRAPLRGSSSHPSRYGSSSTAC